MIGGPAPVSSDAATLVALWTGDELSAGYQTVGLGVALCRRIMPRSSEELGRRLYGPMYPEGVHLDECAIVSQAFTYWSSLKP